MLTAADLPAGGRRRRHRPDPAGPGGRAQGRRPCWSRWPPLVVGVVPPVGFDYGDSERLQFTADERWIDVINSRYHIGIDGISLPLLLLSMVITVLCVIYSWDHFPEPHNPKAFLILMLVLETGMNGTFAAQDLILFFVFFELVLLPMYFMIGVWGGPNRQYAAIKFFLFTLFGSALMILGFLALYFKGGNTFDIPELIDARAAPSPTAPRS